MIELELEVKENINIENQPKSTSRSTGGSTSIPPSKLNEEINISAIEVDITDISLYNDINKDKIIMTDKTLPLNDNRSYLVKEILIKTIFSILLFCLILLCLLLI